jgi:hypothetical protein
VLGKTLHNPRFHRETLIGDDTELLDSLRRETKSELVVQGIGRPATVLKAEFTRVAFEYMVISFNTEDLRPAAAISEAMILTFLYLRDFTFTYPDAYSVLMDTFQLPPVRVNDSPPEQLVEPAGILKLGTSTADLVRPDIAILKPRALRHKAVPFVTRRVIERLDNLGIC